MGEKTKKPTPCPKCGGERVWKHYPSMPRPMAVCRLCATEKYRLWRLRNPERFKAFTDRYRASPKGQEARRRYESRPSVRARRAAYVASEAYKKVKRASSNRRKLATLGRKCVDCGVTDAEYRWGLRKNYCSTCERRGQRNGFCTCGAALRRVSSKRKVMTCHVCSLQVKKRRTAS